MRYTYKSLALCITAIGISFITFAQNMNTHYLYQLNWFNVNPAYTGQTEGVKAVVNPGTQWVGLDGKPTNSLFGLHSSLGTNMGVGAKVVTDKRGVFNNFSAEMLYSYKVTLATNHKLAFGISAGLFNTNINVNSMLNDEYTDFTDPAISSGYYNQNKFISGFGVLYQWKELEIAASAPHLILSGMPVSDHVFGMAKYNFVLGEKWKITPSAVYQTISKGPNLFDFGLKGQWNETIWLQSIYKTNKTIVIAAGIDISKFNFGYAYSILQKPLSNISSGTHEVILAFAFDKGNGNKRKAEKKLQPEALSDLKSILKDLMQLQKKSNLDTALQGEIQSIQAELTDLINKQKTGSVTKEDEKRMQEIEARILALKQQLEN